MRDLKCSIAASIFIIGTNCSAITYNEFQIKCLEKNIEPYDCSQTYEASLNLVAFEAFNKKDYSTAFKNYLENANKGVVYAQKKIAQMYYFGNGITRNAQEAERWYKIAAEKGDREAQYQLLDYYLYGHEYAKNNNTKPRILNSKEALKWGLLSAKQGYPDAQAKVGEVYREGYGTIKNYKEANKWFTLAANQGNYQGFWSLAFAYENGEGVKADLMKAYMLWNLAVATTPSYVISEDLFPSPTAGRDRVEKKLKPIQIEHAQRMASECAAKHYKNCI